VALEGLGPTTVLPPDERRSRAEGFGIAPQIGAGISAGILETPIIGDMAESLATFYGMDEAAIRDVIARGESTPLAQGAKFATELGTALVGGGLAYAGGRAVGRAALAAASRGATAGRLGQAAAFFGDVAGSASPVTAVPGIVKGAQAVGGALGIGTLGAAQEATEADATAGSIARAFGIGAASTLAVEGAIAGIGAGARKLGLLKLPPSASRVRELRARSEEFANSEIARLRGRETQVRQRIAKILGSERQEAALARRGDPQLQLFGLPAAPKPGAAPSPQLSLFDEGTSAAAKAATKAERALVEKFGASPQQLRAFRTAQRQLRQVRTAREGFQRSMREPIPIMAMRGNTPLNPNDAGLMVQKALLATLKSPETMGRELGPTGVKLVQMGQEAEAVTTIGRSAVRARLIDLRHRAAAAMGVGRRAASKDGKWFAPAVEAWERGGIDGVAAFNSKLVPIFRELDDYLTARYGVLAKVGAETPLSANDLSRNGVRAFFPQVVDFDMVSRDAFRNKFGAALAKARGISADEGLLAADDILSKQLRGLRQFGSIDHQRALPGSTMEKITRLGLPFVDDPWHALERYASAVERRIAYGTRFGFKGENRDRIIAAITKEGGNRELASSVADVFLSRKFYDGAMEKWASNIVNLQIGTKLPLAAIANASQNVNTAFMLGVRRTLKHMVRTNSQEHSDGVLRAMALSESVVSGMRETWLEPRLQTLTGKFANFVLTGSGFAKIERYNRLVAGLASHGVFLDDTARAANGRLRGTNLMAARRRFSQLGMDLDDVVRQARRFGPGSEGMSAWLASAQGKKAITQAIFGGVRTTQFTSAPSRMPTFWQHPIGRVLMQFHSFSFNQTKFLRDAVLREASEGNVKPLAGFLSLYPVAGDMVGDVRSLVSGREPRDFDGLGAYLDNFLYVGGLGLATDAYMAARYGRLDSFLLGPTVSDASDLVERLAQGDVDGLLTDLRREPIVTAATRLFTLGSGAAAVGAGVIDEYLDSGTQSD
jgi:hypothetical protein